jgi:hypothetical protein
VAKTWILDTETKGTGAHIAPLRRRAADEQEPPLETVVLGPPTDAAAGRQQPPVDREPQRFKAVDVLTGRVLLEGVSAKEVVALLENMRSVVDARLYVWSPPAGRWRLLSIGEQRALWAFRGRRR